MSLSIGVDIAKDKIDIYCDGHYGQVKNTKKAISSYFNKLTSDAHVVMEATGKYHRLAHKLLESMGFSVMVVNPYQTKHFAKAMNLLCKTDRVDAKVLALFAERMTFKATPCDTQEQEDIKELLRHLDDLKKLKQGLEQRLRDSSGFIVKSLKKMIKAIKEQIKEVEKQLHSVIDDSPELQNKVRIICSIPGVGTQTAIMLLCYLKELGTVNKNEIAALSGLAPVNNDSGQFRGKRRIKGGRHDVRSHLYMPIVGASTQHNERLKAMYDRLLKKGKLKQVALTACMRKLIIWINAMLASEQLWSDDCR